MKKYNYYPVSIPLLGTCSLVLHSTSVHLQLHFVLHSTIGHIQLQFSVVFHHSIIIKPWFNDDCRFAFEIKQGAHLRWTRDRSRVSWDELVHYQRRANAVYAAAMRQFSVRSRDVLMNAHGVPISGNLP